MYVSFEGQGHSSRSQVAYINVYFVRAGNASDASSSTVGIAVGIATGGVLLVLICLAVALLLVRRRRSRRRYDGTVMSSLSRIHFCFSFLLTIHYW